MSLNSPEELYFTEKITRNKYAIHNVQKTALMIDRAYAHPLLLRLIYLKVWVDTWIVH
jgi:hypothetical protein